MKIEKLKPGMVVYDVHKTKMGNTTLSTVGVWEVCIIAVNAEKGTVEASWNSNRAKTYHSSEWSKWRENKPLLIRGSMGYARLATREEIAAHKAKQKETT